MVEKQPVELPITLKGTALLGKAKDLFSENLVLCVPRLVGLILVGVIGFIGGITMGAIIISTRIGSVEEAAKLGIRLGSILGVSLIIIIVPLYVFVDGWLVAASVEMLQTGRAKLTGSTSETVSKRSGQLITAALINFLLVAPAIIWAVNWLLNSPIEMVIQSASFYENFLIAPIRVAASTFLAFFVALIVAADKSALGSLVKSISITAGMIRIDGIFFLCILGYNLLNWLAGLIPVAGWVLALFIDLFITPIIVISVLIYLKIHIIPSEISGA